ncbi:hypothetical protein P7K49_005517, partial [Saguinus oedipus]
GSGNSALISVAKQSHAHPCPRHDTFKPQLPHLRFLQLPGLLAHVSGQKPPCPSLAGAFLVRCLLLMKLLNRHMLNDVSARNGPGEKASVSAQEASPCAYDTAPP